MSATAVASSSSMFSPFTQQTQSSSQTFNPFAPKLGQESSSFGIDSTGDSNWAKQNKRKGAIVDNSDTESKRKTSNPFKNKDANLGDNGKPNKKRAGDGEAKRSDPKKNHSKQRDGQKKSRQQNGQVPNGVRDLTSAGEDSAQRPTSSSSSSSVEFDTNLAPRSDDPHAQKVYDQLRKDGISPPSWPSQPGNSKNKAEMAKFREKYESYRKRVRASLTKAGLIDDPEKRRTLQDAITFRGICEDMCPEYEKITRITELDVPFPEKDTKTSFASTSKMVKKLARSAAGQEAPLPMDVRSTATLRRTLDYLINDLLQNDDNLPTLHGFLWDRTRAIRRDFTFFSSPTAEDLITQAYILENVARFHVTALHLLSQEGKAAEDFVEQQELEQLGKALLSLRDLYDDCNGQGITCENEAEFRAYYLVFHAHDSNIIEMLQRQWSAKFWKDSDDIRTAVSLVEALQNTTDFHGPLKNGPSLAASSAFNSYFRILEDPKVSYTMACFAECHFPHLRRSILWTIKRALTRPKEATKDVTASTLNKFLRFDTVQESIGFAQLHDLEFVPDPEHPTDVGSQFLVLNNRTPLPHPRLQHQFSQTLVERKRGNRPFPDIIHHTIFEETSTAQITTNGIVNTEGSIFVQEPTIQSHLNSAVVSKQVPSSSAQVGSLLGGSSGFGLQVASANSGPFNTTLAQQPSSQSRSSSSVLTPSASPASSNPFAQSTAPTGLAGLTGFQIAEPAQSLNQPFNSALGKPSPFAPAPLLPISGLAPTQKTPSMLEKPEGSKPGLTTLFPTKIDTPRESKPSASHTLGATPRLPGVLQFPTSNPLASFTQPPIPVKDSSLFGKEAPAAGTVIFAPASTVPAKSQGLGSVLVSPNTQSTSQPTLSPFGIPGLSPSSPFAGKITTSNSSLLPNASAPKIVGSENLHTSTSASLLNPSSLLSTEDVSKTQNNPSAALTIKPATTAGLDLPSLLPPGKGLNVLAQSFQTVTASSQVTKPVSTKQPPAPIDLLGNFTEWFVKGDNGLLYDFQVFMIENILRDVFEEYQKATEEKRLKEEEERNNVKAYKFRLYNLSVKYFYLWKENAREKRLKELRKSGREQFRAFHEAQKAAESHKQQEAARRAAKQRAEVAILDRPEELLQLVKHNQMSSRKAEEALLASGVLSGISNEQQAVTKIVQMEGNPSRSPSLGPGTSPARSRSGSATRESAKTRALREQLLGEGNGRFRRSMSSVSLGDASPPHSGSRKSRASERWRLKAMGIVQMQDGTAVPESLANDISFSIRSHYGMRRDLSGTPPRRASVSSTSRIENSPSLGSTRQAVDLRGSLSVEPTNKRKRSIGDNDDGATVKHGVSSTSSDSTHKRVLSDAENLIKELRTLREEMEEGTMWFKSQNGRLQSEMSSRDGTPQDDRSI